MVVFPFTIPGTVTLVYFGALVIKFLNSSHPVPPLAHRSPLHLCMLAFALSMSNSHSHNALSSSAFMLHWLGNQSRANLCMYLLSSCTGVQSHGILWRQLSTLYDRGFHWDSKPSPVSSTCSLMASRLSLAPSGVPLLTLSRCMHALKLHCELPQGSSLQQSLSWPFSTTFPHYALVGCSAFSPTCLRDKTQTHLPIRYPGNSVLPKDLFFLSSPHPAKLGLATSIPDSIAQQTANPMPFSKGLSSLKPHATVKPGLGASYGVCTTHRLVKPKIQPFSMQEIKSARLFLDHTCYLSVLFPGTRDIIPQSTRDHLSPYKWGTGTHILPSTTLIPSKFSNSSKSCCDCCL